jgi:signal transduction histidine kinase
MDPLTELQVGNASAVSEMAPDHVVQFYEDERFLYNRVGEFIAKGLAEGGAVLVVATRTHRRGFQRVLRDQFEIDVPQVRSIRQLTFLDAQELLGRIVVNGLPDQELTRTHLGGAIAETIEANPGRPLRTYGEMVDLLWRQGNARAALRLEEIWHALSRTMMFSRLCAYGIAGFARPSEGGGLFELCQRFSRTLPAESYNEAWDETARRQAILGLQQRSSALAAEIEQRKSLEEALRLTLAGRRAVERERAGLQAEIQLLREELERAQAASTRSVESLAELVHDLRAPLNAILGWTQMPGLKASATPEALEVIDRNAEKLSQMIDALLETGQARPGLQQPGLPQ